jgi:hypothetical protein
MFVSQNLRADRIRKTIEMIPATFSSTRVPSPRDFLDLYKSQPQVGPDVPHETPEQNQQGYTCSKSGCTATGGFTTSTTGADHWYCWDHFMGNDSKQPAKPIPDTIKQKFETQLQIEREEMAELGVEKFRYEAWLRLVGLQRTIVRRI